VGKVKFELSVEKITFKFEGDSGTGQAVNRAMNHTLGSLMEAQNRVIDVTPEPLLRALPSAPTPPKRKHRKHQRATQSTNGPHQPPGDSNDESPHAKTSKQRRSRSEGFRTQAYRLLSEGYFSSPRTAAEIQGELATKRGFTFNIKNVTSDLTHFTKKGYLARDTNGDGKYAYFKGTNDDYPGSQGGS
jgi:hypothetical protein